MRSPKPVLNKQTLNIIKKRCVLYLEKKPWHDKSSEANKRTREVFCFCSDIHANSPEIFGIKGKKIN